MLPFAIWLSRKLVDEAIAGGMAESEAWNRIFREGADYVDKFAAPENRVEAAEVPTIPLLGGKLVEAVEPGVGDRQASLQDKLVFEGGKKAVTLEYDAGGDTFWATQEEMADLFGKDVRTISHHLSAIFNEGELEKDSVLRNFRRTASDGKTYEIQHYNLDVIILVAYRVKESKIASKLRVWSMEMARDRILREVRKEGVAGPVVAAVQSGFTLTLMQVPEGEIFQPIEAFGVPLGRSLVDLEAVPLHSGHMRTLIASQIRCGDSVVVKTRLDKAEEWQSWARAQGFNERQCHIVA